MITFTPQRLTRSPTPNIPTYLLPPTIVDLLPLFDSPDCVLWTGATKNKNPIIQLHNRHIPLLRLIHDWQHLETSTLKLRFHPCKRSRLCLHPDHMMVSVRPTPYNLALDNLKSEQRATPQPQTEPISRGTSQTPIPPLLPPSESNFDDAYESLMDEILDLLKEESPTSISMVYSLQNEGRPLDHHDPEPEIVRALLEIRETRPHIPISQPLLEELNTIST